MGIRCCVRAARGFGAAMIVAFASVSPAGAAEIGHYAPGLMNVRDFIVPLTGTWGAVYNNFYSTQRLNDASGDEVSTVVIGPNAGSTLDLDLDVQLYSLAPMLIWAPAWTMLGGGRFAAVVSPTFCNASVGASLSLATGRGQETESSTFAPGDLYVQPLWVGWTKPHWDLGFSYGVYAPVGQYDVETVTFPTIGPIEVEASDNTGLGFWSQQLQGDVILYPWTSQGTAILAAVTYEISQKKRDFDLRPGQALSFEWGLSQYLPLRKDKKLLLEIGPAGYSQWQVTDDRGQDARNPDVHDQAHAAGGQLGLTYEPWSASLNGRYLYEFAARDRYQGTVVGVSLSIKL